MNGVLSEKVDFYDYERIKKKKFFYFLKPKINLINAVKSLIYNEKDVNISVLTHTPDIKNVVNDKNSWINWYIPEIKNNINHIRLGSYSYSFFDKISKKDFLITDNIGDLLCFIAFGGSAIGVDINFTSLTEGINYISSFDNNLYIQLNNYIGCRRICCIDDNLYGRFSVIYNDLGKMNIYFEEYINYRFYEKYLINIERYDLSYDTICLNGSVKAKKIRNYFINSGISYSDKYLIDGHEVEMLTFDMQLLKELDEYGVSDYLGKADRRPLLFDYMNNI